jgi:hypothetical protein
MADTKQLRLTRIDAQLIIDRDAYLRATWAGHDGEARWYEAEVDRLLYLRHKVSLGWPAA